MNHRLSKKNISGQAGFGLMEIVIAIGIISISFVVLMSLFAYNMRTELANRNRIAAAYLAQEAMEQVVKIRYDNWYAGREWGSGLRDTDGTTNDLIIDMKKSGSTPYPTLGYELRPAGSESRTRIYSYDSGGFKYLFQANNNIGGAVDTGYKRTISVTRVGDMIEANVDVSYANGTQHVALKSYLYKWN